MEALVVQKSGKAKQFRCSKAFSVSCGGMLLPCHGMALNMGGELVYQLRALAGL